MWIELQDEISEHLERIKNELSESYIAINTLLDSMLKGKHIIFASRETLSKISKLDNINLSNKRLISWIIQNYIYVYSGKDIVQHKIIVSTSETVIKVIKNDYLVPLNYFCDVRETKLLTENESDGNFLKNICLFIKKDKKIGDWNSINFENDSGHGANVSSKIDQNAKDDRIIICILDSDREMKNGKVGSTYRGANNVFKKIKKNHIIFLKSLESREKENLLPPNIYELFTEDNKATLKVLFQFIEEENIIKYFDLKDGIKYKKYKIEGWEKNYKPVIDKLIEEKLYKLPSSDEESDEFICLEGIGEKLCDSVVQALFANEGEFEKVIKDRNIDMKNKAEIEKIRKSLKECLPSYMYKEWKELFLLLFSWGCCIDKKKLPNYKM